MDVIALLCNLHADGPATLRVLRRAGLTTPARIEAEPDERLAEILGTSPAAARRFAREAQLLAHRTGQPSLKGPGSPAKITATRASVAETRARQPVRQGSPVARDTVPRDAPIRAPRRPPIQTLRTAPIQTPCTAAGQADSPLRPGVIEGLDAAWCKRLVAQGVRTLESLAEAPGLVLARRLGVSFARLLELQCLAQRHLIDATRARPSRDLPRELQEQSPHLSPDLPDERPLVEYSLPRPDSRATRAVQATQTEPSLFAETAESGREDDYELPRPDPPEGPLADTDSESPFADEMQETDAGHELEAGGPFA